MTVATVTTSGPQSISSTYFQQGLVFFCSAFRLVQLPSQIKFTASAELPRRTPSMDQSQKKHNKILDQTKKEIIAL